MTLTLILGAVVLATLAVLALLWSRWPLWMRAMLVAAVFAFDFMAFDLVHDLWGWPSSDPLPARFALLAVVVEEPAKSSPGALYVWVHAIEDGKPAAQPRAFRLPYSKDLHGLLDDGMKKVRQGVSQIGSSEPKRGRKGLAWLRPGSDEQVVKIRDMPVPQLPEK